MWQLHCLKSICHRHGCLFCPLERIWDGDLQKSDNSWMENLLPATLALAALCKGRLVAAAPGKPCVERGVQSQRLGCGKRWQNVGMCGRCELNTKWLVIFPDYISAFLQDSDRKWFHDIMAYLLGIYDHPCSCRGGVAQNWCNTMQRNATQPNVM